MCFFLYSWRILLPDIEIVLRFFLSALKKKCHFFLASMIQIRNLLSLELMSFYKLMCYFSLPAFKIFSLSLVFRSSIMMCLGIDLFRFILDEVSPTSWACMLTSLTKFEEVFSHYFFEYYFSSTLFLFSSGTAMKQMLSLLLSCHMFKLGKFYWVVLKFTGSTLYSPCVLMNLSSNFFNIF